MNKILLILMFLLFPTLVWAEIIYSPIDFEPLYEYEGEIAEDTVFKSEDFSCLFSNCRKMNIFHPVDYVNNVPLDGFDFYAWERGWILPKKPYRINTFLVKEGEEFVWKPYSLEEIKNIMGD
jgi:hypothetical protein